MPSDAVGGESPGGHSVDGEDDDEYEYDVHEIEVRQKLVGPQKSLHSYQMSQSEKLILSADILCRS